MTRRAATLGETSSEDLPELDDGGQRRRQHGEGEVEQLEQRQRREHDGRRERFSRHRRVEREADHRHQRRRHGRRGVHADRQRPGESSQQPQLRATVRFDELGEDVFPAGEFDEANGAESLAGGLHAGVGALEQLLAEMVCETGEGGLEEKRGDVQRNGGQGENSQLRADEERADDQLEGRGGNRGDGDGDDDDHEDGASEVDDLAGVCCHQVDELSGGDLRPGGRRESERLLVDGVLDHQLHADSDARDQQTGSADEQRSHCGEKEQEKGQEPEHALV